MSNFFDAISVLVLLSSFILMSNKTAKSYIKTFRFQSILLAIAAGVLGITSILEEGHFDVMLVCLLIILLKVIYIPNLLNKVYGQTEHHTEKDFILNIPILVLICCGLVVFCHFALTGIEGIHDGTVNVQTVNSVSVIFIGLFFMISRRKAIGQIIGFLVIEDGIFITAMVSTKGMPFIVDLGIFIDMLTAILIMSGLVFKINEIFHSINIDNLNKLKG